MVCLLSPATVLFAQCPLYVVEGSCQGRTCPPQLHGEVACGETPTYCVPLSEQPQRQWGPLPACPSGEWLSSHESRDFRIGLGSQTPEFLYNAPVPYIPPTLGNPSHTSPPQFKPPVVRGLFLSPEEKRGRTTGLFNKLRRLWQLRFINCESTQC
jgi:hypothetical protein